MTLDVKALREVTQRIIDLEAKRENAPDFAHRAAAHAALSMACETFAHTLPPTAVLALLDRLERAEAIVGAVEAAYYPAVGDNVERHWYRVRSLLDAMRDGHTRAALDDEAPR